MEQAVIYQGYTEYQLSDAWDKIEPRSNWRDPILADVELDQLGVTITAIEFYTGNATYWVAQDGSVVTISSPGYRMGPAGDH